MAVTNYVWDRVTDAYLMETDGTGATTAVYANEPVQYGSLISQRRGSTTSYYHFDALGSTRELTDASQTVTDTNMYDAWGVDVASTGTTENSFLWNGSHEFYITPIHPFYYVRARYYGHMNGRWHSRDQLLKMLPGYVYADNNPVTFTDPSGYVSVRSPAAVPRGFVGVETGVDNRTRACLAGLVAAPFGAPGMVCAAGFFIQLRLRDDFSRLNDKWVHCVATCRAAKTCGAVVGISSAVFKEFLDCIGLGTPDMDDIAADRDGLECAGAESFIPILGGAIGGLFRMSCPDCCSCKHDKYK